MFERHGVYNKIHIYVHKRHVLLTLLTLSLLMIGLPIGSVLREHGPY